MISSSITTEKELREEYDTLYKKEVVRDEDRAYAYFAKLAARYAGQSGAILDIACGGGFFLTQIEKYRKSGNFGLDISEEALRIARTNLRNSNIVIGSSERLSFTAGSFDFVSCLGSLEHFLSPERALNEMARVLKDGGKVFIMVPNLFWYKDLISVFIKGDRLPRNQHNEIFNSLGEWKKLLETNGFKIERTLKYNGISKSAFKQFLKDLLIPRNFSYHFIFICGKSEAKL
ncbi:MAG: methyltransferase domain-containing protein [Candidatus Omnitrophica bacterium]|nr:methyltransferase domain-containing protein [Candidatus Omnitrophota bacterium]